MEEFNPDVVYERVIARSHMIDSIRALNSSFSYLYLNWLTNESLCELEEALLDDKLNDGTA